KNKRRRRVFPDSLFAGEALRQFRIRVVAEKVVFGALMRPRLGQRNHGVTEHDEIRSAARAIDNIWSIRLSRVEIRARSYSEMPAGRESHEADSRRVEPPFGSVRTQHSNRTLRITQFDRVVITRPQPISQNKGSDAERVEIVR